MAQVSPEVFAQLLPPKKRDIYEKNIEILEKGGYIKDLCIGKKPLSLEELLESSENIPRELELFLIIDFELKRTLICDFLFALHKDNPTIFSLEKYLYACQRIFSIITQFRWSKEDLSFVLKIIFIYLGTHMKKIQKEKILHILERFQGYGPWTQSELEGFFYDTSSVKVLFGSIPKSAEKIPILTNASGLLKKIIGFWKE